LPRPVANAPGRRVVANLGIANRSRLSTLFSHENVGGLDVSVYDALRMSRIQSIDNFEGDVKKLLQRKRTSRNKVFQCCAFQIFHDQKGRAILFADVMEDAYVPVVQSRSGFSFTAKPLQRLLIVSDIVRQNLTATNRSSRVSWAL